MKETNSERVISLEGNALIEQYISPAVMLKVDSMLGIVPLPQLEPTLAQIKGLLSNTLVIAEESRGHIHFAHPIHGHLGTLHICKGYSMKDSSQYIE